MHPADDDGVVAMTQADFILVADKTQAGLFQRRQLLFGRPTPEADVGVETGLAIAFCVGGGLEPDSQWKESGIRWQSFGPFSVRVAYARATLGRWRGQERANDSRQQPPRTEHRAQIRPAGPNLSQNRVKKTAQRAECHDVFSVYDAGFEYASP